VALTLESEQRLEKAGLVKFFNDHRATWLEAAQRAYNYARDSFPQGAAIRPDDVANPLTSVIAVNEMLRTKLSQARLTQRYWVGFFVDLIIDRVWQEISGDGDGN
jgi:hypothetical protein